MNKLLPERPNLGHLKDQARDLVQAHQRGTGDSATRIRQHMSRLSQASNAEIFSAPFALHEALWIVAREYGFPSWPKLKAALDIAPDALRQMKQAIEENDIEAVRALLRNDANIVNQYVVRTKYYFGNHRPLTYAAQRGRVEIVKLLLEAGADLHAEGHLAIARASRMKRSRKPGFLTSSFIMTLRAQGRSRLICWAR